MLFNEDNVVDAQKYAVNAKACIQKNGRLGFTKEAADLLKLEEGLKFLFSTIPGGDLAAIICDASDARGFRVQKAGNYFYIRMKNFFDSQSIDYIERRVSYDISETPESYQGKSVYKFKFGSYERRSNSGVEDDDEEL